MRKSIFIKYFSLCSAVILISFLCLGAVLLLVSSQYFVGEKKDILFKNVRDAVVDTTTSMNVSKDSWQVELQPVYNSFAYATGADIFLTDAGGKILICSQRDKYLHTNKVISESILKSVNVRNGTYVLSDLDGLYENENHNVIIAFSNDYKLYYMFASSPKSTQTAYIGNIMQTFLISALIVIIFACIFVYLGTLRVAKPIMEMSEAAKRFGKGDFSQMLNVEYDTNEITELANAMNEMAISLSHFETMRRSFVANVSHELRTPMTSISGFIDGILDGTIPQKEQKKYLRIVSDEIKRLSRLVRSMLNMSKIEAGEMHIKSSTFNVMDTVMGTLLSFEKKIQDKNIEILGLDCDRVLVYADNDLIHQVIYNLIENAVKFVNNGGTIEFSTYIKANMTFVSIRNSGEGLSQEELPLVFDRFYKTDQSRGLDKNGVGLGLYIVRSIINMHEGNIMVTSVKGEFTEFIFSIPSDKNLDKRKKN